MFGKNKKEGLNFSSKSTGKQIESMDCNKCGKLISSDDKFCMYCGVPLKNPEIVPEKETVVKQSQKLAASALLKWIGIAILTGLIVGWVRYWIGYYVLIQGVIVGLIIPWLIGKTAQDQKEALANVRFKMAILLFFSFMIAQAFGFGLAQPVFDSFNWLVRVWNGDTTESVFAIFSTGGVVHSTFSEGLNGGFWVLLSFIDLFFMFFFILISLPLTSNKKRS